jgi:hypothetical protein
MNLLALAVSQTPPPSIVVEEEASFNIGALLSGGLGVFILLWFVIIWGFAVPVWIYYCSSLLQKVVDRLDRLIALVKTGDEGNH